jgi:hypothetical protein
LKGIGPKCPYYLDPSKNEMTGRKIEDPEVIEYILTLHNEVRYVCGIFSFGGINQRPYLH